MDSTMNMTHVNASVEIHQVVNIHTISTLTPANVIVDHIIATQVNTLISRVVAANAQSTRPAQTINTSMKLPANVSVK